MRMLLFSFALASLSTAAPAQIATPRRCDAAEYRQFDFWLGDWEVRDAQGAMQGQNRITREYDGCVVQEHWSAPGQTGSSFNVYDALSKKWHQTWVDSTGHLLLLDDGLDAGSMLMRSPGGSQRIRWTPLSDGRVRQLWEASDDSGKSWKVKFDGYYAKKK